MPKKIEITDDLRFAVKTLFDQGLGSRKIAAALSISRTLVKRVYVDLGIDNLDRTSYKPVFDEQGNEIRTCIKCGITKPIEEFAFNDKERRKRRGDCRDCERAYYQQYNTDNKEKITAQRKTNYEENKEEILAKQREYYQENKEEIKVRRADYFIGYRAGRGKEVSKAYREAHKDEIREKKRAYYQEHRDEIREKRRGYFTEYYRAKRELDPVYRLMTNVSRSVRYYLTGEGSSKDDESIWEYLPYTLEELRAYLESLFEPWMTWDNYGRYNRKTWKDDDPSTWTWNIDHIIPQSLLPFKSMDEENFLKCWALSNLRPLSAKQNLLDGAKKTRHNTVSC